MVHGLSIQFFDTVAPGTALNIIPSGQLFLAGEASNHVFYQFKGIGDDEAGAAVCLSQ